MVAPVPYAAPPLPVPASPVVRDDLPLGAIAPDAWDAIAGDQPFLRHAFLSALHETGCATRETGWQPRYLTAWSAGELVGALPLYEKMHSYGEYVFDWGWADAYRRHGRRYYPKLVAAIPFTPVPGPRLLAPSPTARRALLDGALARISGRQASSFHLLFPEPADLAECLAAGMIERRGIQFHWVSPGWRDFADYLAAFNHAKRKKIRQERRKLAEAGVTFVRKTGRAIAPADWAFFYRCYERTYRAHHSTPYLSLAFFERLGAALGENLLLVVGQRAGRPICAALDVFTSDVLWGRYWGATESTPGLHFEACYYQAIEFCLERGIRRFEGGAQGVHKLARGLLPATTYSVHAIADPAFARAIADYCARERVDIEHTADELGSSTPFKSAAGPPD